MPITKATASSIAPAAKGDLVVGSATNDASVLAVGSANQVLTVDSSTATGLKWAAASSPSFVGVSAGGSQSTVVTNGTTYYALVMNAENFDTDSFHDNSTNNTRITIPSGKGGKYQINVQAGIESGSSSPGSFRMFFRINGSGTFDSVSNSQINMSNNSNGAVNNNGNKYSLSGILNLTAGDYFETLFQSTNGSGTMNVSILCSAVYLGA